MATSTTGTEKPDTNKPAEVKTKPSYKQPIGYIPPVAKQEK